MSARAALRWTPFATALAVVGVGVALVLGPTTGTGLDSSTALDEPPASAAGTRAQRLEASPTAAMRPARGACVLEGRVHREGQGVAAAVVVRRRKVPVFHPHGEPYRWTHIQRALEPPQSSVVARTRTAVDGTFTVGLLSPGEYEVEAVDGAGAREAEIVSYLVDGDRRRVELELGAGAERIWGRVSWTDGRPFRGVVHASQGTAPDPTSGASARYAERVVVTDDDGRYEVRGLRAGPVRVGAAIDKTLGVEVPSVSLPRAQPLDVVLDESTQPFDGRVVDIATGAAIGGAAVYYEAYEWDGERNFGGTRGRVETDAEGAFHVRARGRLVDIHAVMPGYAPVRAKEFPDPLPTTFRLRRAARLRGRVTSAIDGAPVHGIVVSSDDERYEPGVTGPDGRYELEDLAPGELVVHARGDGWIPKGLRARTFTDRFDDPRPRWDPCLAVLESGQTAVLDLVVERGVEATGLVITDLGAPVAGARVWIEGDGDPSMAWTGHEPPPAAVSGPDGRFRIGALLPDGEYEFSAETAASARTRSGRLPRRGDAPISVTLTVPSPRWITVRVVEAEGGAPIPGAWIPSVAVNETSSCTRWIYGPWRTLPDGTAIVGPLPPFSGDLEARAPDHADASSGHFPVPTSEPAATVVTVKLSRENAAPKATAKPPPPAPEARVSVSPSPPVPPDRNGNRRAIDELRRRILVVGGDGKPIPYAYTGRWGEVHDGVWVCSDKAWNLEDRLTLDIWWPAAEDGQPLPLGPASVTFDPRATGTTTVTLPPEKTVTGVLVGPDGRPLDRVKIEVRPAGGDVAGEDGIPFWTSIRSTARTRADGSFVIGRLAEAEYRLTFVLPDGVYAPAGGVRARGGTAGLTVRTHAGIDPVIRVVDARGAPVVAASVAASVLVSKFTIGSGTYQDAVPVSKETTDSDGRAVLHGLDPLGAYRFTVAPPDDGVVRSKHEESDWKPNAQRVRLARLGGLAGSVVDGAGRPVSGATVFLRDASGGRHMEVSTADGEFEFSRIEEGECVLTAAWELRTEPDANAPTSRAQVGDRGVRLVLAIGSELVVRIADAPAARAGETPYGVLWPETPRGGSCRSEIVGGTIRFRGLEEGGRYTLWVAPMGTERKTTIREGLVPGPEPVTLELSRGKSLRGKSGFDSAQGVWITARGPRIGMVVQGTGAADGSYRVEGLVDGRWEVTATDATSPGDALTATGAGVAGGEVDLHFARLEK